MRLTESDKLEVLSLYKDGLSCRQIANQIGTCTVDTVWKYLKKQGLDTSKRRLSESEVAMICDMYVSGHPAKEILPLFPRIKSENTIIAIIKEQNIVIRKPGITSTIRNENFFDNIDSEEKAYVLGLIIADGCVSYFSKRENRSPVVSICLHKNDSYLLEKIKELWGTDNKTYFSRNEAQIKAVSRQMADALGKYGVVPRKSFVTRFPYEVQEQYWPHLIRGIFDGDGCISKNGLCSFYGSKRIVQEIQQVLFSKIDIPMHKVICRDKGAFSITFAAKKDVKAFYHYIYENATIWLERKRNRFIMLGFDK